jgi:large subunit ribosomal protein L4
MPARAPPAPSPARKSAGGGRKPYKQKGTGRARQGSIRTPLRPGGGVIFGPKPRSYELAMNRKERRLALRTALMARDRRHHRGEGLRVRSRHSQNQRDRGGPRPFRCADPEAKALLVLHNPSEAVRLSVRNLEKVKLIAADQLNVFDLLHASKLVLSVEALNKIQEVYGDD